MKRSSVHFKGGQNNKKICKTESQKDQLNFGSSSDSSNDGSDTECSTESFSVANCYSSSGSASDHSQSNYVSDPSIKFFEGADQFSDTDHRSSEPAHSESIIDSDADDARFSDSSLYLEDSDSATSDNVSILSNSDFEADSDSSLEDDGKQGLSKDLQYYVSVSGTAQKHTNLLLKILRENNINDIPKSYRTLMQTPKNKINGRPVETGLYFHYMSLRQCILKYESMLKDKDLIEIDIGVDGFKPFKGTPLDIWPVMGAISHFIQMPPFLIGCYSGQKSPKDADILLADLCHDIDDLKKNGVYFESSDRTVTVQVRLFIADAPGRAMICSIKGHSSYEGCPLCVMNEKIFGDAVNYTASVGDVLRDNHTFASRLHPDHHRKRYLHKPNCLERIGVGMVSQVPIDPMHAVDLGATKKKLKLLKQKKTGNEINIDAISDRMLNFKHFRPSDFARDCRSLDLINYFKATELRVFLFYACIVFLKGLVDEYIYKHWLLLHCAVRLLAKENGNSNEIELAAELLKEHGRLFPIIYGEENVSYNIHVLPHIPYYVALYGHLDNFSMFKFENFIQMLKKLIRKADRPLQQIYNRLEEIFHIRGNPVESKFNSFDIRDNENDSFLAIRHQGEVIAARFLRYKENNEIKYVKVLRCLNTSCFYSWPIASDLLGEITYDRLSAIEETFLVTEIDYKYCRIPYGDLFVLIPILHTVSLKFKYNDST